jgi:hypothetical protein
MWRPVAVIIALAPGIRDCAGPATASPLRRQPGPMAAYQLGQQAGVDSGLNTGADEEDDQ